MFFRNLTIFRFPMASVGLFPLQETLAECALRPVGPLELSSRGFVSPLGRGEEDLVVENRDCRWLSIGGEDRILPAAVVNDLLARKLAEIEEREGRLPSGRTRKRIKEELLVQLIPQAFVAPSRTDAYLDLGRGLLLIDTPSRRNGEQIVSEIRRALGSFPALPLNAEVAPRSILTGWLAGESMPEGWSLGEECELRDALSDGAVVKVQNEELSGDEIRQHLESGKQCTRLAVVFENHLSFVLGEDLVIRKLKFLDGAVESLEEMELADRQAELRARFALMTGELGRLFDSWEQAFKLSRADESQTPVKSTGATVTVSAVTDGQVTESVTMDADDFKNAAGAFQRYQEALGIVRETGNTGISHLQRRMKVSYNAAVRLLEAMEERGVLTPPDRAGKRTLTTAGAR